MKEKYLTQLPEESTGQKVGDYFLIENVTDGTRKIISTKVDLSKMTTGSDQTKALFRVKADGTPEFIYRHNVLPRIFAANDDFIILETNATAIEFNRLISSLGISQPDQHTFSISEQGIYDFIIKVNGNVSQATNIYVYYQYSTDDGNTWTNSPEGIQKAIDTQTLAEWSFSKLCAEGEQIRFYVKADQPTEVTGAVVPGTSIIVPAAQIQIIQR
jgi:hypothetical protein